MIQYLSGCVQALRRGLIDGTQTQSSPYAGSTTEVALYNAASEAVRIAVFGHGKGRPAPSNERRPTDL